MTSAFSSQNSVSLSPASFCTSRPNLPVIPGVSGLATFAFLSSIMQRTSFLAVSSKRFCRSSQNCSTSASSALLVGAQTLITVILNGLPWIQTDHSVVFLIASQYCTFFNTTVIYSRARDSMRKKHSFNKEPKLPILELKLK